MSIEKHFVTFLSPGTFLAENRTSPIDSWDVSEAQRMAQGVTERHSAIPYGFYFTTRSRGENDLDSHQTERSPTYFLPHCRVETLEEVKSRNFPNERTLILNMESNGYKRIVKTTRGWQWTQPFNDDDVLLPPLRKSKGGVSGQGPKRTLPEVSEV